MIPISKKRYLSGTNGPKIPFFREFAPKTRMRPRIRKRDPWPISPNIIPKKNGKVTIDTGTGFAS